MKRFKRILWGLALVALGVILGLNAMEITSINLLFEGWWTLFLIVPGVIGLLTEKDKSGNLIVVAIGVFLLLASQDRIGYDLMWKLLLGLTVTIFGLRLIFKGLFKSNSKNAKEGKKGKSFSEPSTGSTETTPGKKEKTFTCFSSHRIEYSGREFHGAELSTVFGEIVCDLRFAIFTKDTEIRVRAVFGEVTVLLPANLNVKVSVNPVFGDVNNNNAGTDQMFPLTLNVEGSCVFGDVSIL